MIRTIKEDIEYTKESTYRPYKTWEEMTTEEKMDALLEKQNEIIEEINNKE